MDITNIYKSVNIDIYETPFKKNIYLVVIVKKN